MKKWILKSSLLYESIFLSLQGEGKRTGVLSVFLRLAGCNLKCKFCDTLYAVDKSFSKNWKRENPKFVYESIKKIKGDASNFVITGGEPLLQREAVYELLKLIKDDFETIEIETNGTIDGKELFEFTPFFNVSLKLSNSGEPASKRLVSGVIGEFVNYDKSIFKFVVSDENDIKEIKEIEGRFKIKKSKIFLMPMASNYEELKIKGKKIADLALKYGYNYSHRLHIDLEFL